jgi:peptidoglycan-associated lipoprotein
MKKIFIGVCLAMLVAGCASNKDKKDTKVDERSPGTTTTPPTGPATKPATPDTITGVADETKNPNSILSKRIIYFDFDRDTVRAEFVPLVQAHAKYLGENRNRKIRLEGHADERGSREYNMALGQRRAEAVRRAMGALGVGNERAETISFGEDKPRATGSDEASWAQNRRVEIVYDGE